MVMAVKMSKTFSHVEDELLIDQVREFPSLYDHGNKDYKDFQIRENIWKKIAEVILKDRKYQFYYATSSINIYCIM